MVAAFFMALAGCFPAASGVSASSPPPASPQAPAVPFTVYFLRHGQIAAVHRTLPSTRAVGIAALRSLVAGPTSAEARAGFTTAIPRSTRVLGLTIQKGIATVDLTTAFASGGRGPSAIQCLAQVTYTLTQFPGVRGVKFALGGHRVPTLPGVRLNLGRPVVRGAFEPLAPAVLLESPSYGDTVRSPMRVVGSANTFEATFYVRLVGPQGRVLAQAQVHAASGSGTRGRFDATLPFRLAHAGIGTLSIYVLSAKDGTRVRVSQINLLLTP